METRKTFLDRDCEVAQEANAERRVFLTTCSAMLLTSVAAVSEPAVAAIAFKRYQTSILSDERDRALRASTLKPHTNYLFHYPFVATPALLIDLGRDVGGAGKNKSIVAFSAICSHKLAYPAKEVAFIRFQAKASTHSEAERIHCCADHSVYDPALQGKVVAGPAPAPLAAIMLDYNESTDELRAIGTAGAEQFDAFFTKYDFKLGMEYSGKAKNAAAANARVQELTNYCRNVAQC
jgi:arsenite oxidase small subunit